MRLLSGAFGMACLVAALAPLAAPERGASPAPRFPGWPSEMMGMPLSERPLNRQELDWQAAFPGRLARFDLPGGQGELLVRWVFAPTRKLHPSTHCYRGNGYRVRPLAGWIDPEGRRWSRFRAESPDGRRVEVSELVVAVDGTMNHPDVSSWYWQALLGRDPAPGWWALTWSRPTGRAD